MYRVLLADDNKQWLAALEAGINQQSDFQVVAASNNGKAALTCIEQLRPDVLILDIIMPEYDGVYILNHIRNEMVGYHPIVYILSGTGSETIISLLNDLSIDFYSLKPVDIEVVIKNLYIILHKRSGIAAKQAQPMFSTSEQVVYDILSKLGMPMHLVCTQDLAMVLAYYLKEPDSFSMLTKVLYPQIAKNHHTTAGAVEKSIRSCVKRMEKANTALYNKLFPVFAHKKITNRNFLMTIAAYLTEQLEIHGLAASDQAQPAQPCALSVQGK